MAKDEFRICPTTGLKVHLPAERLIKANAVTAVVFLAVGGLFGLMVALTRWRDECLSNPEDVAVMYVAGHGLQFGEKDGGFVMLQDFNDEFAQDFDLEVDAFGYGFDDEFCITRGVLECCTEGDLFQRLLRHLLADLSRSTAFCSETSILLRATSSCLASISGRSMTFSSSATSRRQTAARLGWHGRAKARN